MLFWIRSRGLFYIYIEVISKFCIYREDNYYWMWKCWDKFLFVIKPSIIIYLISNAFLKINICHLPVSNSQTHLTPTLPPPPCSSQFIMILHSWNRVNQLNRIAYQFSIQVTNLPNIHRIFVWKSLEKEIVIVSFEFIRFTKFHIYPKPKLLLHKTEH